MSKPTSAGYYDQHEAGRLIGAYRLLEAVLGEDRSGDRRDRRGRGERCQEARQPAKRVLAMAETVSR